MMLLQSRYNDSKFRCFFTHHRETSNERKDIRYMQKRGTAWVVGQIVLLAAIVLVPPQIFGLPTLPDSLLGVAQVIGAVVGACGLLIVGISALNLGSSLTIFPRPLDDATLIQSGLYALVRHPIYCGVILSALGWSILRASLPSLLLTLALGIFFDRKASQEERWLTEKYPDYPAYRSRVHKLIPWVY